MKKLLLSIALFSFVIAVNAGEPVTTSKKEVKSSCCKKDTKSCCKKDAKACADKKADTKATTTTTTTTTTSEVKPTGTK